jgi:hypothetical protein
MRGARPSGLAFAVLAFLLVGTAEAGKKGPEKFKPTRPYVEGEVVVQYKDGPESWEAREANQKMGATVLKVLKKMNLALVQLPPATDTIKAVEQYRKLPGVVTAEPNYIVSPLKKPAKKSAPAKKPSQKKK